MTEHAGPERPTPPDPGGQPTEAQLRAAYEAQLREVHVDDVLVQTVLSLLNLGAMRAGLTSGGEAERDPAQLRSAIEGIRALLPIVEQSLGQDAGPIREALSQLQLAYARGSQAEAPDGAPAGAADASEPKEPEQRRPGDKGPAQASGRLWVPGQ